MARTSLLEKALITIGVLGTAYFVFKPSAAAAPSNGGGGLLPPIPNPQPQPAPAPNVPPVTDPAALTAYVNQILTQVAANPRSVDPAALDQAAAELDQLNMPAQAAAIRAAAVTVRAALGQVPVTGPGAINSAHPTNIFIAPTSAPPGVVLGPIGDQHRFSRFKAGLPAELGAQMGAILGSRDPAAAPAALMLAQRIETLSPGAFAAEVMRLRQHAAALQNG